jgi:hypothetical protein
MSHMGTSHVGQMGCRSLEDVSAVGTAKNAFGSVDSNVRSAAQSSSHRINVIAGFTLIKVCLWRLFSANGGFPFQLAATMGARTRIDITRLHVVLHL